MNYVTSDLHGFAPKKFVELLNQAGIKSNDTLYILGDIIDRGNYGIELLLQMIDIENIKMLPGNHESMFLAAVAEISPWIFDVVGHDAKILQCSYDDPVELCKFNGGTNTLIEFNKLDRKNKLKIINYLINLPLYYDIVVGDKRFVLTHSGISEFSSERPLNSYDTKDYLWTRPELFEKFYGDENCKMIFGHTPTNCYGEDYMGKVLFAPDFIDVDTGSGHGGTPSVLCLENMNCYYYKSDKN